MESESAHSLGYITEAEILPIKTSKNETQNTECAIGKLGLI